jgi:hypothetical protein
MSQFGAFNFASPFEFSDWARYAGFDRKTGEMQSSPMATGIKPPEDMQQYLQQRFAPVQNKMNAIAPAAQQISQGNIVQGMNTYRAGQPAMTPTVPGQAPATPNVYDYTYGL